MFLCQNCGAELSPGSLKCRYCGSAAANHQVPPRAPSPTGAAPTPVAFSNSNQKSRIAAGLPGILLGALGIHNFYLGFTGKGIAQLLVTVLSCTYLSPISFVWGLIEGILILTGSIQVDARGVPLRD